MKKNIIISILILSLSTICYGQNVDMDRMERDLEIAKNVLQSLLGEGNNYILWSRTMESSYLEGYGVIFTLPTEFVYSMRRDVRPARNGVAADEKEDPVQLDSNQNENEKTREAVTTFLVDYADLISQLSPSEKIMVHAKNRNDILVSISGDRGSTWSYGGNQNSNFSAEIAKKDISEYKQGKITREEIIKRIEFSESKPGEKEKDLELFSSIIKRLYSPDLSNTFFTDRAPSYERIKGFGVIFYMETYSSYQNNGFYRMPVLDRSDVNEEERRETVEGLYPKFKEELTGSLIEYGRTIGSLESDETILLKVKTTKCNDCKIPSSLELSIKKSILSKYDQRKISLEEARKSVKINEHFKE